MISILLEFSVPCLFLFYWEKKHAVIISQPLSYSVFWTTHLFFFSWNSLIFCLNRMNYCLVLLHSCHLGLLFHFTLGSFPLFLVFPHLLYWFSSLFAREYPQVMSLHVWSLFILSYHLIDHLDIKGQSYFTLEILRHCTFIMRVSEFRF